MRAGPMRPQITEAGDVRQLVETSFRNRKPTCEEDSAPGAREVVRLMKFADIGNSCQSHVENNDLNETGECGSDYLSHEHRPGRDFHIVTKFEVRHEVQRLRPGTSQLLILKYYIILEADLHRNETKCFEA